MACRVCGCEVRAREGVSPELCLRHMDQHPQAVRVAEGLAEIERESRRIERGGAVDPLHALYRDVLSEAASAETPTVRLLARQWPERVVRAVLKAAGVRVETSPFDRSMRFRTDYDQERATEALWEAAEAVMEERERVAQAKNTWQLLTYEEFLELYSRIGAIRIGDALGLSRAAAGNWRRRTATPSLEVQQVLVRLAAGETPTEAKASPRKNPPQVKLRPLAGDPSPWGTKPKAPAAPAAPAADPEQIEDEELELDDEEEEGDPEGVDPDQERERSVDAFRGAARDARRGFGLAIRGFSALMSRAAQALEA